MKHKEISVADIQRVQDKVIDDYFWKYYGDIFGHCSLCGNNGVIDTRETGAGINYCICPNGRAMREQKSPLVITAVPK